ncbi:MAG: hypothetical protein IJ946_05015 [Clostridia bacterium]|nr:hypothetical protein [Clostridia bacterium]
MNKLLKRRIKNNRLVRKIYYGLSGLFKNKKLKAQAIRTVDSFGVSFKNQYEKKKVISDMVKMYAKYGYTFEEYLYYDFKNLEKEKRLSIVADWEHMWFGSIVNDDESNLIFDNKWETYNIFGKYYGRDVLICNGEKSAADFENFVNKHKSFIIKPLNSSCGNGIKIVDINDYNQNVQSVYKQLLKEYNLLFIIEQLIVQNEIMAKFHPASVNTIRIPTLRLDGEIKILHPFMRLGSGGKCVDNAGQGGIICAVAVESGELFVAADEYGKSYDIHPDSKEQIIGFTVPEWEEAKKFVEEMALLVPNHRYVSWDVALTEKGWVLVEANSCGQFVWQIATKKRFREEMNQLLKQIY